MRGLTLGVLGLLWVGCGSIEEDRPARWSFIAPAIIEPSCATSGCHSMMTQSEGIQLDTRENSYYILVNGGFVVPGRPDVSKLVRLLRGDELPTMPPDGPLPEPDIRLIEQWILEGAHDN